METRAKIRYARIAPLKVRRVIPLIKGKRAGEALIHLGFLPQSGSRIIAKILKSAMANAEQKKVADPESMKISNVLVDHGPTMKRMMPRAMGRADVIRKRTSHITVILEE